MNFLKMTNRVRYTLGLEDISVNDEVALAKEYLNEGVVDILSRTRPYTRVINLVAAGQTPVHDMHNTILALLDLQAPNDGPFLERVSREDAVTAQRPVQTEESTFKAYGVFRPDPMVADDDDPATMQFGGLAPEFHPAAINYALWKGGEYLQHEQSGGGERWRVMYEGQDGTGGDIARIKRILTKRVTPSGGRRRDLTRNLGALSRSGDYIRN
jgi:hypothetical protein